MTWGLNRTSGLALIAAAGLAMGGWSLEVKAADLGGGCCADLEERVADLEATTVRKGNRKVSLELSGQVNRALVSWNDGRSSDGYIVDNENSNTRFRLKGTGTMSPGWKGGFYIELGVNDSDSADAHQFNEDARGDSWSMVNVRQANVFMESEKFGRVTIGQGSGATDDLGYINLGGSLSDAGQYFNNSFYLRRPNGDLSTGAAPVGATALTWGTIVGSTNLFDSARGDYVRYDTPSLYGFILSAAWGDNDVWDVALRYQKEWNSFRVAAGVGYYYSNQNMDNRGLPGLAVSDAKRDKVVGSASIMHVPTGFYLSGAAVTVSTFDPTHTGAARLSPNRWYEGTAWYIQPGITKRFFDVGASTVYGEYGNYDDIGAGFRYNTANWIRSSDVERWGVGATQAFDGAALEVYVQYHHYSAELTLDDNTKPVVQDWDAVVSGMKLKF
jgi:hypothetical protein